MQLGYIIAGLDRLTEQIGTEEGKIYYRPKLKISSNDSKNNISEM